MEEHKHEGPGRNLSAPTELEDWHCWKSSQATALPDLRTQIAKEVLLGLLKQKREDDNLSLGDIYAMYAEFAQGFTDALLARLEETVKLDECTLDYGDDG